MPGKAAKITVTERQHNILLTLRNAITAPAHLRQRAAVILLAFDGRRNEDIAAEVGLGRRQVGRWRRRWAKAWSGLIDLECRETKADLRRAIAAVLTDAPRPGAPGKFTPEQVTQILAVACEPPAKSGRPITHWTAHELADEVVKRGIVTSISTSQVSRYLRAAALQPHKSRYWLNTTEKVAPQGTVEPESLSPLGPTSWPAHRAGARGRRHSLLVHGLRLRPGPRLLPQLLGEGPIRIVRAQEDDVAVLAHDPPGRIRLSFDDDVGVVDAQGRRRGQRRFSRRAVMRHDGADI